MLMLAHCNMEAQALLRPRLKEIVKQAPAVVIFLGSTCPICQKYAGMLNDLSQQYAQVQWVGVFTKWETEADIQQFVKEYDLKIPLYFDEKNRLLRQLDATTTPEVFLLDKKGTIQYKGAIDNWFYGLGKYRPATTEYYLTDALDAFLQGKAITIKQTKPVGCVVEQ